MRFKKKGFTLVELIIVIIVLGVLAAIAIVSYSSAQVRSRDAKRKSDVSKLATAISIYKTDYKTYDLSTDNCDCGWKGPTSLANGSGWVNFFDSEYGSTSIFKYLSNKGYISGQSLLPPDCTVDAGQVSCDGQDKDGNDLHDYMYYSNATEASVYAQLEGYTADEKAEAEDGFNYDFTGGPSGNRMNFVINLK